MQVSDRGATRRRSVLRPLLPGKCLARQPFVRFDVLLSRPVHDIGGQRGRFAVFVPVGRFQVLPHELFVKLPLVSSRFVFVTRPIPRTVRSEHFINQRQLAIVPTPFKFSVGQDQSAFVGILRARLVNVDAFGF